MHFAMLLFILVRYVITKNITTHLYFSLSYSLLASVPLTTKIALMSKHTVLSWSNMNSIFLYIYNRLYYTHPWAQITTFSKGDTSYHSSMKNLRLNERWVSKEHAYAGSQVSSQQQEIPIWL